MWYKNITGRFFGLVTKHVCDRRTDGRTGIQNYDSQDRVSIAASRSKNGSPYVIRQLSVCLSVSLSVLSVTLVYCAQTVGWIKMKLGTELGIGASDIVLDGDPAPP